MTARDVLMLRAELFYSLQIFKGKNLIEWAVTWFKMSNDDFFRLYGFNFNPHKYPMLYEIARKKVYEKE